MSALGESKLPGRVKVFSAAEEREDDDEVPGTGSKERRGCERRM